MNKQSTQFKFRLYVVAGSRNSAKALANLTSLCDEHLTGQHEIEIVNILQEPARAVADGIVMTPTLLQLNPFPLQKVVGTLSDTQSVLQALGLEADAA